MMNLHLAYGEVVDEVQAHATALSKPELSLSTHVTRKDNW